MTKTLFRKSLARPRSWLGLKAVLIPMLLLFGCSQQMRTYLGGRRTSQIGTVSKEQLRERLKGFEDTTTTLLRETSQTLRQLDPNVGTRRSDVIRNLRYTQALQVMLDQEDPMVAFLETWGLTLRLTDYFKTGYGQGLFGEHQTVVVNAAERLVTNIEKVGKDILNEQEFEETSRQMRGFARRYPVNETFSNLVIYATEARPGEPSPFQDVLSIPLSPFTALKGVDRTASAIYSVKESVNRTADVVESLPESARWQAVMLLEDMKDAEVTQSLLASASTLSQSSARFADIADGLPQEVREQASILIQEIDDKQANLQQTLDKTRQTAAAIDHSLGEAKSTIEALEQTASAVTVTAEQWQSAARATGDLVTSVRQWRDSTPEKPAEPVTTIQDYQETIRDVTKATNEMQVLLADVRDLLESEAVKARIDDVQSSAEALIDHIAWRLIQLAGVIALVVAVFRFAIARSARASKSHSAQCG